jgi:uncharacterized protein (DUF1501 family)
MLSRRISRAFGLSQNNVVPGPSRHSYLSDFSRTFQPNSNSGTDHGWGSHHIVLGGAVRGAKLYGTYPTLALAGPDDSGANGRWIPSTASVQYASTLVSWFGVGAAQLNLIFPGLSAFGSTNLGFV